MVFVNCFLLSGFVRWCLRGSRLVSLCELVWLGLVLVLDVGVGVLSVAAQMEEPHSMKSNEMAECTFTPQQPLVVDTCGGDCWGLLELCKSLAGRASRSSVRSFVVC